MPAFPVVGVRETATASNQNKGFLLQITGPWWLWLKESMLLPLTLPAHREAEQQAHGCELEGGNAGLVNPSNGALTLANSVSPCVSQNSCPQLEHL